MTSKFVAATMLVVIAGIAAAMTGSSFIEQSRVQSMHSDMHITSIQLHDMHDAQKAFVSFTIVNSGTSALVSSNLSFYDDTDNLTNITLHIRRITQGTSFCGCGHKQKWQVYPIC